MVDASTYFNRTITLRNFERTVLRGAALDQRSMPMHELEALRWAFTMARLELLRADHGDVDLFEQVAPFRHWFVEQLEYFADPDGKKPTNWAGIRSLVPGIVARIDDLRAAIIRNHVQHFDEHRLDKELRFRKLVLVLGGGGGAGYSHLGTFAVISELGLVPSMIVGSSMGSLLGLFRSVSLDYDPVATAFALPRPNEVGNVFSPYRGFSRFGFPGTVEMKARTIGEQIFRTMLGIDIPRISELPIAFRPLATGLRTGIGLAISEFEGEIERAATNRSPLAFRRRVGLFTKAVRTMISRPRFLEEIVFGSTSGLEDFHAVDAVGFSCAVPGIIHYDLYGRYDDSIDALTRVFAEHRLFRLTDGGIVNNVASRAAWRMVHAGEIGSRNACILSFDAFAPRFNRNALFIPAQQAVRPQVLANRPYSDYHVTYENPPSPVRVLQSFEGLQSIIADTRRELERRRPIYQLFMRPLPAWEDLRASLAAVARIP